MSTSPDFIRTEAAALLSILGEPRTIYLLQPADAPQGLNVIGGPAPAIEIPETDEYLMVHLLTLDLQTVPALAASYPEKRALSIFVSGLADYPGLDFDDGETKLVFSTDEEMASGFTGGQPDEDSEDYAAAAGFTVVPVEVPAAVFALGSDVDEDSPHYARIDALQTAIYRSPGYVGGAMIGSEAPDDAGDFVLTARQPFLPLNLGDGRSLVVYREGGFCGG